MADSHSLRATHPNRKGVASATAIVGLWAGSLIALLSVDATTLAWWVFGPAVVWQTFLYTGLFITAHDAMHRTITPDYPRINDAIGQIAVGLYALFSYRRVRQAHWRHHDHPVSNEDPDFHGEEHAGFGRWYLRFMITYLSVPQLVGMAAVFTLLQHLVGVAVINLVVFWVVPALASTVQLFYFGTYLPHRKPPQGHEEPHRATSNDFAPWLSFLTCYHFGYHREHHERPDLPWWRLPELRKRSSQ